MKIPGMIAAMIVVLINLTIICPEFSAPSAASGSHVIATPSGEAMPLGNIPGWDQVFADNFDTNVAVEKFPGEVSGKWSAYPDGWNDTHKNGTYMPSRVVSIHDGMMDLHLHTENGVRMVAALLPKIPGGTGKQGGMQYGRYAIRFKADPLPCYETAWLLWPDSEIWPGDGEIDFPEGHLDGTINAYMHHMNGDSEGDQDEFPTTITYTSWHTAVLEWSPDEIVFYLDGKVIGKSKTRIPNTPMHWVIQTETAPPTCIPKGVADGHVLIDWVVAYKKQK